MPQKTPRELGYHMPAEWEPHTATWVIFPHNDNTWPEHDSRHPNRTKLDGVQRVFAEMIAFISEGELVHVIATPQIKETAQRLISHHNFAVMENIIFHDFETMDSWIRDSGPTFVVNKKEKHLAMVDWIFNAWGMKYEHEEPLSKDDEVARNIHTILKIHAFNSGIIMEGGSIEVNGRGTVITTEQCLLNQNRNPNMSKEQIEKYIKDYLNVNKIIWLKEGIEGDDTDGHIDDIARFVNEHTVLCCMPEKSDNFNYKIMKENLDILKKSGLMAVELPMPGKIMEGSRRLPASYANFYIANSCVIVPIFKTENDAKAIEIIQKFFPNRKVVGLYATDVVFGFGSWHCLTQQEPGV